MSIYDGAFLWIYLTAYYFRNISSIIHARLSYGLWKYWNFQSEVKVEQIIAIVTTRSVSFLFRYWYDRANNVSLLRLLDASDFVKKDFINDSLWIFRKFQNSYILEITLRNYSYLLYLTHFTSMFPFYTSRKHHKTRGFLMFSEVQERDQ